MLKQRAREIALLSALFDLLLLVLAFLSAYVLRVEVIGSWTGEQGFLPLSTYSWMLYLSAPLLMYLLHKAGMYGSLRRRSYGEVIALTARPFLSAFALMGLAVFLLQEKSYSRTVFLGYFLFGFVLLATAKLGLRALARGARRQGFNTRNVIIVGTNGDARRIGHLLAESPEYGYVVLGHLLGWGEDEPEGAAPRLLGHVRDLPTLLDHQTVDEVVLAVPYARIPDYESAIGHCEEVGVPIHLKIDRVATLLARTYASELGDYPMLTLASTPQDPLERLAKRFIDIAAAAALLTLLAPLLACVALAVRCTSSGPVFFRQTRAGLNGRRFVLYKFRSMRADAESRQVNLLAQNEMSGPVFKMRLDPRVTPVGRLLRRWSLDELPQLWNVLRGDMSLVGPRPPIPDEVDRYERWQRRRLSMKPGLTCLWQVRGRNHIDFDEWMKLDMHYIDNWSLGLDLRILARTIPAVLFARGAR